MKSSQVFLAFLGGAVVGGVLGVLFAPKSGKETRQDIRDFVGDEVDQAKEFVGRNVAKAKRAVNTGREILQEEIAGIRAAVREEPEPAPTPRQRQRRKA